MAVWWGQGILCCPGLYSPRGRRLPFLWPQGVFSVPWGDRVWRPLPWRLSLPHTSFGPLSSRPDHQGRALPPACIGRSLGPWQSTVEQSLQGHTSRVGGLRGFHVRLTTHLDLAVSTIIAKIFPAHSCRSGASPASLCCLLPPQISLSCLSFQAAWSPMISAL